MTECPSIQLRLSNPVEDQKEIKIRMTVLCSDLGNEQQWIYPDSHNGFFFLLVINILHYPYYVFWSLALSRVNEIILPLWILA